MIDYCKQILGKSIRDLTIEDLKLYFSEVKEETEILEFKSGQGDFEKIFNNNILKTVSAFLNSSGGVLIWGSPEDKAPEKGMPKVCIGDLMPVTERKEKDQLINRISSSISYMPTGIKVERLEDEIGYVYVIEVQESESKPHQLNGQYFIRLDGQSKPAPHYIIDSMFNQMKYPILEGYIDFTNLEKVPLGYNLYFDILVNNRSTYLCEKNLTIFIKTNYGTISRFSNSKETKLDSRFANFAQLPVVSNLHYGMPTRDTYKLFINNSEVIHQDNIFTITLIFAGDKSPAKNSFYRVKITDDHKKGFDFKILVEYYFENKSFKELQDEEGTTNELFLKKSLRR